ncbi:MAG: DUF4330 family protein [Clostridiales bacterium]|nr:DUF4330 family protein [Clostridiales bacterium]
MKVIDKNMKLFGKVSLLDILIILIVIAGIIAAGAYFGKHGTGIGSVDTQPITYEVMVKKVDMEIAENIKVGDQVNDRVKGYKRGVVESVVVVLHSEKATDLTTGAQALKEYPGLYDVVIKIAVNAEVTDRYINLSGNRMDIGKEAYLQIGSNVYKSWVSAIEIHEEGGSQ